MRYNVSCRYVCIENAVILFEANGINLRPLLSLMEGQGA